MTECPLRCHLLAPVTFQARGDSEKGKCRNWHDLSLIKTSQAVALGAVGLSSKEPLFSARAPSPLWAGTIHLTPWGILHLPHPVWQAAPSELSLSSLYLPSSLLPDLPQSPFPNCPDHSNCSLFLSWFRTSFPGFCTRKVSLLLSLLRSTLAWATHLILHLTIIH